MERNWWWKASGFLLLTVIAVVYLTPTVVGEDRLPKWYTKRVKNKLQLGLDLQGGIHLEYEVDVAEAVSNKADRLASDLEKRLREQKINVTVEREEGTVDEGGSKADALEDESEDSFDQIIALRFADKKQVKVIDKKFLNDFGSTLEVLEQNAQSGVVKLKIKDDYVKNVSDHAIRQAKETIRGRVDEFGVAEPNVFFKGTDIVVELPGLKKKDFDRVKKQIGRTAQLEFKMVDDESGFMRQAAAKVPKDGPIEVRTDSYDGHKHGAMSYTYLSSRNKKALQDFIAGLNVPKDREILLGEDYAKDEKGNRLPDKIWTTNYVIKRTELTGESIADADVTWDDRTGKPEVGLTFDTSGADAFADLSGNNIGRRMAIVLDEKVNSAPVFQSRIGGGRARITLGGLRSPNELMEEARDLAAVLKTGALPAPLRKTFEQQVGPTLGRDAIEKGKLAFMIGAAAVLLFVLYYYRGAGLICNIALLFNFLFIAAIMAAFNATLTLPGIAGLVLTIGMAVDANVIIYERIREEAALGKTPRASVDAGYSRAFWTIFDAQLTTAIAALVLMQWGTGPIRGFAVTLLVGIICSVFTGVVMTRFMFDLVVAKFRPKQLSI